MFLPSSARIDGKDRASSAFARSKRGRLQAATRRRSADRPDEAPVLAKRLANDIPGTTGIVWMKNSAHMPMVEEPKAYADAVLAFVKDGQSARLAAP